MKGFYAQSMNPSIHSDSSPQLCSTRIYPSKNERTLFNIKTYSLRLQVLPKITYRDEMGRNFSFIVDYEIFRFTLKNIQYVGRRFEFLFT